MNKWLMSRSRRERAVILAGAVVLVVGLVIVPLAKRSAEIRAGQMEELEQVRDLLGDYQSVIKSKDLIEDENEYLSGLIGSSDQFLFERTGNNVMMEAMMTKLLNQFGPDLKLDVSEGRGSLRSNDNQIHFDVKGTGRYPDILNLIHQIERHRPIIVIDAFSASAATQRSSRRGFGMFRQQPNASSQQSETTEPTLRLKMEIHINCISPENES